MILQAKTMTDFFQILSSSLSVSHSATPFFCTWHTHDVQLYLREDAQQVSPDPKSTVDKPMKFNPYKVMLSEREEDGIMSKFLSVL